MRRLLALLVAMLIAQSSLRGHPGCGIAVDGQDRVFVTVGASVVMIDTNGDARTILSDPKHEKFYQLHHIRHAPDGGMLTASDKGDAIWRFTAEGTITRFYPEPNQEGSLLVGLGGDPFEVDVSGNVYAINSRQGHFTQILKISSDGLISSLAGGTWGHADGTGAQAKFAELHSSSIVVGPDKVMYLTDSGCYVRRITPDGQVSTVAGGASTGFADGPGRQARFNEAMGLALKSTGDLLVADSANHRIRQITRFGLVSTVAGSGMKGSTDGDPYVATFTEPTGVALSRSGEIYVREAGRVRKISKYGKVVTVGKFSSDSLSR